MIQANGEIGLVLSGGGFRGMAHIGVIKYIEEIGLHPSFVAGTSAGAIVGALYAAGYSSNEILDFFLHTRVFSWKNYAYRKAGILEPLRFSERLKEYLPENDFAKLRRRFFVARTNLFTGEGEIISEGELIPNIMASAALPLLFAPVEINGVLYADGGIVNNFPVGPLLHHCQHILGVYVNPLEMKHRQDFKHTYHVMERAFHISMAQNSTSKFSHCEVMIVPEKLKFHSLVDIKHIRDIFELGYEAATKDKEQLQILKNKITRNE